MAEEEEETLDRTRIRILSHVCYPFVNKSIG